MLWELPFVQEAKSPHTERQYRRDGGCSSEEGGGTKDSSIAAESCGQVNLLGEEGRLAYGIRGSAISLCCCVEWEGKGRVEVVRRCRLEDE